MGWKILFVVPHDVPLQTWSPSLRHPWYSEPLFGTQTPPLVLQPSPGTPTIPWYSNPPLVLQPSPGTPTPIPATPTPIPATPTPILVLQPPFVQATTLILTRHSDFGGRSAPTMKQFSGKARTRPLSAINNIGLLPSIQALHCPSPSTRA